ncbi:MAG: hypothetical protein U9R53_06615 [Chloroflexota bacterium]|nr:hypothetical protein [Chloroflexota bacterium]
MNDEEKKALHKKFGIELFNQTWDLIDKEDKDQQEIDRMIHAAHASRYHWEFAGGPVNIARGEWQISRVYALLKRAEPCLYHAERCLQVTLDNDLKDFDLAFAYEAIARACNLSGDHAAVTKYMTLARDTSTKIADPNDRKYFLSELQTIQPEAQE